MKAPLYTFLIVLLFLIIAYEPVNAGGCTLHIDSLHHTNVSCNGVNDGTLTIYASGGNGTMHYSIGGPSQLSNSFTGLAPSTFGITVTDNISCIASATVSITQPAALTVALDTTIITTVGGSDGSIDATVLGGTPPYTFLWSTFETTEDITNLGPGHYCVIVTDHNGCSVNSCADVVEPDCTGFSVTNAVETDVSCFSGSNGSIVVPPATGGHSPYQYALNTGAYQSSNIFNGLAAGSYTVHVRDTVLCIATISSAVIVSQPAQLTASVTHTDVTTPGGNNGSATATVTGGTIPYGCFQWSSGDVGSTIANLNAGTYCVTVCDSHACMVTACGTVSQPNCGGFAVTQVVKIDVLCANASTGTISVVDTGGTPPYRYSLNGGPYQSSHVFGGLAPGSYTIGSIDTTGCTATWPATVFITSPSGMNISMSTTNPTIVGGQNGSIQVSVTGGTPVYGCFQWNNFPPGANIINLNAGTYCVTVCDANNCTVSACATLSDPGCNGFNIDSVQRANVSCNGQGDGQIIVYTSGGTPNVLASIDSGITYGQAIVANLSPGTYILAAKDAVGCTDMYDQNPVIITQPPPLSPTLTVHGDTLGTQSFSSYDWFNANGAIAGAGSQTYIATATGDYYVRVTDGNGCFTYSDTVHIVVAGIEPNEVDEPGVKVLPNPFTDKINIVLNGAVRTEVDAAVYDVTGRFISEERFRGNTHSLQTTYLASGAYVLTLKVENKLIYHQLIKQ